MPKGRPRKSDRDQLGDVLNELEYRVRRAERRHAKCDIFALLEEIGEVGCDLSDGRNPKSELLDVATCAIRLAMEHD